MRPKTASPRVLFVIPGVAAGSSMVFARRQAQALKKLGIEVYCFFLQSRTSLRVLAAEAVRIRAVIASFHPNVVHAHFGTATALFAVATSGYLPVVITYRGSDLNFVPACSHFRATLGRLFSQVAALGAARIVCVSPGLRARLWWRRERASVLPSGVDTDTFHTIPRADARQKLKWNEDALVILFNAGHDARNKRLDLAEAAANLLRRKLPSARLEVLRGTTPPELVPLLLNAANCLLVTSDSEGSPTIVQEAVITNLPVVTVDVGDVAERLHGITETRIVERDPQALSEALLEILLRSRRSNGRERSSEISSSRVAAELVRLYTEAIVARSSRQELVWNTTRF